jgi:predicted phage terminase large subunit-like protein
MSDTPLTIEEIAAPLKGMSLRQAIRLTPATLAYHLTDGRWIPAKHLLYVAGEIAKEVRQGDARLIVQAPPRHGKSELISVHTPTWFLDQYPKKFVMLTSYNADLPAMFARRVRDTIAEYGGVVRGPARMNAGDIDELPSLKRPVLDVRLRADARQVAQFHTSENGGMFSQGIGGSLTGRGADLLLVDDFVKNAEEAESAASQDHIWDWFASTAYTRLEPGGSLIILATRWNIDDLIGKILQNKDLFHGRWRVITLPAEADIGDPLGRAPGEALWPERYPIEALHERKALLGRYFYSALFQQKPIRRQDAQTSADDIQIVDILPDIDHILACRSWDMAGSEGKGDYTVGTLWGCKGNPGTTTAQYGIYDIQRGQWASKEVEVLIRTTAETDGLHVVQVVEQEPGSAGKAYAEYIATKVLKGFRTVIVPANESKWIKAQPMVAAISNKQVSMKRAKWNEDLKKEFEAFPGGKHDDIIDSGAIGFNYLVKQIKRAVVWGRESKIVALPGAPLGNQRLNRGVTFGRFR